MYHARFFAAGEPKPQPRARAFARGGHARVYDAGTAEGWKGCVALAAREHLPAAPIAGPVALRLDIRLPRPKAHFTKKGLRPDAPIYVCAGRGDADNFAKAVMDALTQIGLWKDDIQVVRLEVEKLYGEQPGAWVTVEELYACDLDRQQQGSAAA